VFKDKTTFDKQLALTTLEKAFNKDAKWAEVSLTLIK
jgi:hypothetical protein